MAELTDCECPEDAKMVDLEHVSVILHCAACGQFDTGMQADLDTVIATLENMRKVRVYGQRPRQQAV